MPQLDKVTFLSQFFWLAVFYLGFYFIVLKYFLPKISRILSVRQKKMSFSQSGYQSLQQEKQKVGQNLENFLSQGSSLSRNSFINFFSGITNWQYQSLKDLNKTYYKTANQAYGNFLRDTSVSQNTVLYNAGSQSRHSPEILIVKALLDKEKLYNIINLTKSFSQVQKAEIINQQVSKKSKKK